MKSEVHRRSDGFLHCSIGCRSNNQHESYERPHITKYGLKQLSFYANMVILAFTEVSSDPLTMTILFSVLFLFVMLLGDSE